MDLRSPADSNLPEPLPAVAVVIPVYNGEADLPGLLEGLNRQTYPVDRLEIWLVDNGSDDRTAEIIQAALRQHSHLHYLRQDTIQSSYAARNAGIVAARSEIIAFTDVDCRPTPEWLAELVQPFQDPQVGLVAGEIQALTGHSWLERYADRQQILSQRNTFHHPFCPYGQTANLAIRTKIFSQVGLFRPHLTTGGDADLCWRILRSTPWQMVLAESAVVHHRHRDSLQELRHQWYRYGCSNRYLHDLHGIELMRPLTPAEMRYRLARWLLKELPRDLLGWFQGRAGLVDFVVTPLDLVCFQARTRGQQEAQLPAEARRIPLLEEPAP
ncbi:glycosyltransferase [filamentous cyanobacterium CCP5]|nr:glycosyltransferase [filamentous cyanobacterium CCP5]